MDLLRRYSNRSDLLARLAEVRRAMAESGAYERQAPTVNVPARPVNTWRVRDRLTDDEVRVLIADYLAGTYLRELAERHNISLSALKVLLKRHGVRRTPSS